VLFSTADDHERVALHVCAVVCGIPYMFRRLRVILGVMCLSPSFPSPLLPFLRPLFHPACRRKAE
jgi:hypothetical protein